MLCVNTSKGIRLVLARAVSATPPSIVIVAPVLGDPECVRVVLNSSSSTLDWYYRFTLEGEAAPVPP